MAFPGVVKPWPLQPHPQLHPFAGPPWNTPSPHQVVATSPLATNVHSTTANAHILYQRPFSQASTASPVKTSPVTTSPPSVNPLAASFPASTASGSLQPTQMSIDAAGSLPKSIEASAPILSITPSSIAQTRSTSPSPVKKKRVRRKRCWTCEGCQRKENCGTCSVCTNSNATNSVCKMRRCEALKRRPSLSCPTPTTFASVETLKAFEFGGLGADRLSQPLTVHSPLKENTPEPQLKVSPPKRKRRGTGSYKPSVKEPPPCGCPGSDEGFYYTHLGAGPTPEKLREMLEARFTVKGKQLRMVEVTFCGIEAKTAEGCPTAEWIIRRKDKDELFCVVYRHHKGHVCDGVYTVISIVLWEGLSHSRALHIYRHFTTLLPTYGFPTPRKCEQNETKTCACQGNDKETRGCSFSFGCSWSVYYDGCKFAKSRVPRKFKLQDPSKEEELETTVQALSTDLAPVYKWLAPDAYKNQVATQEAGLECRLGHGDEKPFSGITACMDFCAHSHYDRHNMTHGGATLVCTILKKGVLGKDETTENNSEQLHVLPLYRLKEPPARSIPGLEIRPVEGDVQEVGYEGPTRTEEEVKRLQLLAQAQGQLSLEQSVDNEASGSDLSTTRQFPVLNLTKNQPPLTRVSSASPPSTGDPQTPSPVISNHSSGYGSMSSVPQTPSTPTTTAPPFTQAQRPPFQFPNVRAITPTGSTHPTLQSNVPTGPAPTQQTPTLNGFHQVVNGFNPNSKVNGNSLAKPVPTQPTQTINGFHPVPNGFHPVPNRFHPAPNGFHPAPNGFHPAVSGCNSNPKVNGFHPALNGFHIAVNGFHPQSNGMHRVQPQPGTIKQEHNEAHTLRPVDNLISTTGSSSCTDSDSDCYMVTESSPAPSQESPSHPLKLEVPQASTLNGLHSNPLFNPTLKGPQLLNGYPHQLERKHCFTSSPKHESVCGTPESLPRISTPAPLSEHQLQSDYENYVKKKKRKSSDRVHAIPGGVALALGHGSILIECAKKELHATTPIKNPCRTLPTRLSIVFYQHKKLTRRYHGWYEEEEKQKLRNEENARQKLLDQSNSALSGHLSQFNFPGSSEIYPAQILAEGFARGQRDSDSSSECSDSLEYIHSLLEEEEGLEMEMDNPLNLPSCHVPRAVPYSEVEEPFYVEVPIEKVDSLEQYHQMSRGVLRPQHYPFQLVSVPTQHTNSLSNSICKPQDVISGSFSKWHT